MNKALQGVIIFTAIEEVTLVVWGLLLDLGKGLSLQTQIIAAAVLFVGLFIEHYVSVNVGSGRAPFGPLPPDRDAS
jgi:hypothetical protein